MLIKESINQCLYLTVLITSIMYTHDSAISIRNQTLSLVYLLHLFSQKRFFSLTAFSSDSTLSQILEEESSFLFQLL